MSSARDIIYIYDCLFLFAGLKCYDGFTDPWDSSRDIIYEEDCWSGFDACLKYRGKYYNGKYLQDQ